MLSRSRGIVKEGDDVILYFGFGRTRPLTIQNGYTLLQCREGVFPHSAFIGARYGDTVEGKVPRNETKAPRVVILQPNAELWTNSVPHRTQIMYIADISLIVMKLRLSPGCVVAEAGTGSGSLTHSLARAVSPGGKVHTFDFHEQRVATAALEFKANGLGDVVVSGHRDVCSAPDAGTTPPGGYGLPTASVDAVFLDVPSPWLAVPSAVDVLRPNGMLCSFSPCIEQTQKMCQAMRSDSSYFLDIHTVECLIHEYNPVRVASSSGAKRAREAGDDAGDGEGPGERQKFLFKPANCMKGHTAFLTFARRRGPLKEGKADPPAPLPKESQPLTDEEKAHFAASFKAGWLGEPVPAAPVAVKEEAPQE